MSGPIDNTPMNPATGSLQSPTEELARKRRIDLIPASQIKSEHLEWLIPNWVPHRSITLLAGREGLGKSTIACGIAAQATTGGLTGKPINVAYVATEDSLSITVKPRLVAADADLNRVRLLNVTTNAGDTGALSLPGDIHLLADALEANDVKLVILDAAKSAMHSSLDGYRDDDVRRFLEPLAALCDDLDIVVIGLVHFGKRESTDPGKLILGSIAWSQIARSVLSVAVDDEGTIVVTNTKGNLAPKQVSREARIESMTIPTDDGKATEVGRIVWGNETDRSASELLASNDDDDERSEAESWLEDFLKAHGATPRAEVLKAAHKDRVGSESTVKRAFKKLGGVSQRSGFPAATTWSLPIQSSQATGDPRANIDDPTDPTGDDQHKQDDPTGTNLQSGHDNAYDPTGDPAGLSDTEQAVLDALGSHPLTVRTLRGCFTQAQLADFGVDDLTPVLDGLIHRGLAKEEPKGRYILESAQ